MDRVREKGPYTRNDSGKGRHDGLTKQLSYILGPS